MSYSVYKLRFTGAVHFGSAGTSDPLYGSEDHFRADTLFSALCHIALSLDGSNGLKRFCDDVENGDVAFSDSFPYDMNTLYLPKPYYGSGTKNGELSAEERKAMKKMRYIPVDRWNDYIGSLCGTKKYDVSENKAPAFGCVDNTVKVRIADGEDSLPYQVGLYRYYEGCGLYFIASFADERCKADFELLLDALGLRGIGGRVSSGYGKFAVHQVISENDSMSADFQMLFDALGNRDASRQMLLSTALPPDEELDDSIRDADYMPVRRSGFVVSDALSNEHKKLTQYFMDAGSTFSHRFSGKLYEVGCNDPHPVLRYSVPLFLGVRL